MLGGGGAGLGAGSGAGAIPGVFEVGALTFWTMTVNVPELVDARPLLTAVVRAVASVVAKALWMLVALPAPAAGALAGTVMMYSTSTVPLTCNKRGKCEWRRRDADIVTVTMFGDTPATLATPCATPKLTFGLLMNVCGLLTSIVKPP